MYDNLEMPWAADPQQTAFSQQAFTKFEWDRDGVLTDGKDFFAGSQPTSLEQLERALGTASMVTRWREAHPDLAHSDKDCVTETVDALRPLLQGQDLRDGSSTAILIFKRT